MKVLVTCKQIGEACIFKKRVYLPPYSVLKESSLTTKLRIVFDAFARSSTGVLLNNVFMCGLTVQDEFFSILVRFRKYQYVFTADVEKMFRQIVVDAEVQDFQCILWRESRRTIYKITTVTYGTTSASFMATQCLASRVQADKKDSKAASAIRCDFFMDDLMTGAKTIQKCVLLQTLIDGILGSTKLPLRK